MDLELDLDALELAAQAATPGVWSADKKGFVISSLGAGTVAGIADAQHRGEDADYIVAAQPAVALALIARCKRLEHALGTLIGETDDSDYMTAAELRSLALLALRHQ